MSVALCLLDCSEKGMARNPTKTKTMECGGRASDAAWLGMTKVAAASSRSCWLIRRCIYSVIAYSGG